MRKVLLTLGLLSTLLCGPAFAALVTVPNPAGIWDNSSGNLYGFAIPGQSGTTSQVQILNSDNGLTITSASANALSVGATGQTNPVLNINASTSNAVTGVNITGLATGGTTIISCTDSASNSNCNLQAKGTGNAAVSAAGSGGVLLQTNGASRVIVNNATTTIANAILGTGTKFTTTGCSVSATVGGADSGTFTLGANSCTVVVTLGAGPTSAGHWQCPAWDQTAPTVLIGGNSSSNATTASFTIPAGAGTTDTIAFGPCIGTP